MNRDVFLDGVATQIAKVAGDPVPFVDLVSNIGNRNIEPVFKNFAKNVDNIKSIQKYINDYPTLHLPSSNIFSAVADKVVPTDVVKSKINSKIQEYINNPAQFESRPITPLLQFLKSNTGLVKQINASPLWQQFNTTNTVPLGGIVKKSDQGAPIMWRNPNQPEIRSLSHPVDTYRTDSTGFKYDNGKITGIDNIGKAFSTFSNKAGDFLKKNWAGIGLGGLALTGAGLLARNLFNTKRPTTNVPTVNSPTTPTVKPYSMAPSVPF